MQIDSTSCEPVSHLPAARPSGISVLVPSYRRHAGYTADFLAALAASATDLSQPWECIIIDDSGHFASHSIESACRLHGARYLQGPRSVSAKVNLGANAATYATILDLGADCFPQPGLLAAHLDALSGTPPEVVGVAGLVRYVGTRPWYWRIAEFYGYNACYDWARTKTDLQWAPINVCFDTGAFLSVGGYPEDGWTRSGGDDVALGEQLRRASFHIRTAERAGVTTPRSDLSLSGMFRTLVRYGGADAWLCSNYPMKRLIDPNPIAVAAIAGLAAWVVAPSNNGPNWRNTAGVAAATLLAVPGSRAVHYTRKAIRLRHHALDGATLVAGAVAMGWAFRLGSLVLAVRKGKPWLAAFSFDYDENVGPPSSQAR
jgi:hypothetical protein